jgi:hypothetical protein
VPVSEQKNNIGLQKMFINSLFSGLSVYYLFISKLSLICEVGTASTPCTNVILLMFAVSVLFHL